MRVLTIGLIGGLALPSPAAPLRQSPAPPTQSQPPATTASTAPATTQFDPAAAQQQRQLQVFGPILLNGSDDINAETRRNAALELLDMGGRVPEALDVVRQALQSRKPQVALAAAAALQTCADPPPALLDALAAALDSAPAEIVPSLSAALARYGDDAAARVSDVALRASTTAQARLNAVMALGSFRSRNAAAALMRVMQNSSASGANSPVGSVNLLSVGTQADLRRVAIASLERMTGLSYGQDVAAWQAWWTRAADDTDEQWYRVISESLASRAALLQQQLLEQRAMNDRTSRELFSTYHDLYPALPIDEQLRRLGQLLQHKLAPVRAFALSRVGILTRDSVRMPPEVVDLVRAALNDEAPDLRQSAAQLLDELNDEHTADAVAARLAVEQSPQVAGALLAVLGRRPTPAAIDPALRLLDDQAVGDQAADALWAMMQSTVATTEGRAKVREAVHNAMQRRASAATLRLAAYLGDDRDVVDLTLVLDGEDRRLRGAVAEGFCKRGLRQPLIDRADDEAIYPFAIRALADGPADLAAFNLLVGMKPADSNKRLWSEMVIKLASRLQPADLPAADDALKNLAYADAGLRRDAMIGAAALPRDTLPAADRLRIVERLAPLLIDLGDAVRAWDILETLSSSPSVTPSLRVVHFQAAALTGHFDRAAQMQGDPAAWIALLARETQRGNPACPRLYDEVVRRFATDLGLQDRQRLSDIGAALHRGESG